MITLVETQRRQRLTRSVVSRLRDHASRNPKLAKGFVQQQLATMRPKRLEHPGALNTLFPNPAPTCTMRCCPDLVLSSSPGSEALTADVL